MNLVRAGVVPGSAALASWSQRATSSDERGPARAITDRYAVGVRPRPGETPHTTFARLRERLLAYDIYPRAAVLFGVSPSGTLSKGTVIVQRVQFGVCAVEAGVRVVRVWDTATEAGFIYVTLQGHPEWGLESFGVRLHASGAVTLNIEARSRPGHLLTVIGFPFARAVQLLLTRAALRRLAST